MLVGLQFLTENP